MPWERGAGMHSNLLRNVCFVIAASLSAASLFGQGTTLGSIVGTVTDPSSSSVPGAKVRVLNVGTGIAREVTSDDRGNFTVVSLIPGLYSVEVTAPSFQKQTQEHLRLEVS